MLGTVCEVGDEVLSDPMDRTPPLPVKHQSQSPTRVLCGREEGEEAEVAGGLF